MTARTLVLARPMLGTTLPFALPIGLSAFLLFSVEPMIGRLLLPVFGGAPAVWATILFFFQGILLIGYLYGHVSVTRLGTWGPPLHVLLTGLALVALLTSPARVADLRVDGVEPVFDLVRILLVLIGLPALVLTTTTPLLTGWFEATRADRAVGDGYWLYALSNAGSLLALVAYPFLIEPRLPLTGQRSIWTAGYVLLVILLAFAATRVLPSLRSRPAARADARMMADADGRVIDGRRRARWLLLAAVPSGLLSAVTTFIATDLVSAPLLWVAPLAIYLLSFIVAFSPRGGRLIRWAVIAAPAMVTVLWVPYGSAGGWPVLAVLAMELVAFGVVAVALHGRLAQDRPDPSRSTEFYLILSLGGALASAFVALVALAVFPGVWELPILLVAGLVGLALVAEPIVAAPGSAGRALDFSPFFRGARLRLLPYVIAAAVLIGALVATRALATEAGIRWLLVGGLILLVGARPWFLAIATAFVLALATFVLQPPAEFRDRSFFGVTEVVQSPDGQLTLLMNGTTVHGSQATDPAKARSPQSYYVRSGPVGDVFEVTSRDDRQRHVAIAGLGGGALATYVDADTQVTFFEIDPVVIDVASDPAYFTYLADAPVRPLVVEGDARLSFEDQPTGRYDMVVLDAFSSDAVPAHLLTVEAMRGYLAKLKPDGVIILHLSNRNLDLMHPAQAVARAAGGWALAQSYRHGPSATWESDEDAVIVGRSHQALAPFRASRQWETGDPFKARPWTDDYTNLAGALYANLKHRFNPRAQP